MRTLAMLAVLCLYAAMMIAVPALIGYMIGGDERTAWATSITASVMAYAVGLFLISGRGK